MRLTRVLPRPFPKATVRLWGSNVPFGSTSKPTNFQQPLELLKLKKTVWALNIELSDQLKCFVDSGTHETNVWY